MQLALKLLINRDYAFLWAARTVSNLGDWVFVASVTLWIATGIAGRQLWAPVAVGGAGIAVAVPTVSIGPLAGVSVDRWDKRRTMIAADLIRFGLMALILVPTVGTQLPTAIRLGAIYTVIVLATVCSTFFGPAQIGLLGSVAPPERRTRAASLSQLSVYLGLVLGPPLAAPLLFGLGPAWGLAVNAASFVVSSIAMRAIAARAPGAPEAVAGVRACCATSYRVFASLRSSASCARCSSRSSWWSAVPAP
jgi:MFS transporter